MVAVEVDDIELCHWALCVVRTPTNQRLPITTADVLLQKKNISYYEIKLKLIKTEVDKLHFHTLRCADQGIFLKIKYCRPLFYFELIKTNVVVSKFIVHFKSKNYRERK